MQPLVSSTVPTHPTIIITVNAIITNVLPSLDLLKKEKAPENDLLVEGFRLSVGST